jgi:hypothetical protein
MRYDGAEPGTAITVTWWAGGTELAQARREIILAGIAGWANAWIEVKAGLPPGAYVAKASVSGGSQDLATAPFRVK